MIFVTRFTSHVLRVTNNGLLMRSVGAGIGVIIALSWTMVHLAEAVTEQGPETQRPSMGLPISAHAEDVLPGSVSTDRVMNSERESPTPVLEPAQGPALTVPAEMIAMFQQRRQDLENRENAVRTAEGRLAILKAEIEQVLSKVEAIEQRRLAAVGQQAQRKQPIDLRAQQLGQLAKMYESMPAEEAAARIERMADRKALEILRLIKTKSAGAILAQVKVDRAAKLTEKLLATPQ